MMELFQVEADTQIAVLIGGLLQLERDPCRETATRSVDASGALVQGRGAHRQPGRGPSSLPMPWKTASSPPSRAGSSCARTKLTFSFRAWTPAAYLPSVRHGNGAVGGGNAARIQNFLASLNRITRSEVHAPEPAAAESPAIYCTTLTALAEVSTKPIKPSSPCFLLQEGGLGRMPPPRKILTASCVRRRVARGIPLAASLCRFDAPPQANAVGSDGIAPWAARFSPRFPRLRRADGQMKSAIEKLMECREFLSERMADLEVYDRRSGNLSNVSTARSAMPHASVREGVRRCPRMVRDLGLNWAKKSASKLWAKYPGDRDILEKIELRWRICFVMPWITAAKRRATPPRRQAC